MPITDLHPCNESVLKIKMQYTGLIPNRKVHIVKLANKGLIVHLSEHVNLLDWIRCSQSAMAQLVVC